MSSRSEDTRRARQLAALACAALLATAAPVASFSDTRRADETQVKAAFLFNFAKFTSWPVPAEGPLVIGVAGDSSFVDVLERATRGRTLNGRELVARQEAGRAPVNCHVLFIPAADRRNVSGWLARTKGAVLTVGETPEFLRDGGMVRLYLENNRLRFQISQKNAEAAGLKISSQLLMLAAR